MDSDGASSLVDLLPDAVFVIDGEGVLLRANPIAEAIFGWPVEEWLGRSLIELIHPEDLDMALMSMGTVTGKDHGTPIELRVRGGHGWRLVEVIGTAFTEDGADRIVLVARDLTERRRWEVAGDDTEMFRSLIQNAATLTMLTDARGLVRASSAALIRLTGRDPEDVIGGPLHDLVASADRARLTRSLSGLVTGEDRRVSFEIGLTCHDGTVVPCQLTVVDLRDDPTIEGLVVSCHDISELQRARQELVHLAEHDALTGLANRTNLSRDLAHRIVGERSPDVATAVAFIDLDRFKPVNDLYGHDAGDELLVEVANRLRSAVRDTDTVARFGGDEFVVVAGLPHAGDAPRLEARLGATLARPFDLSVGTVHISASIGVVVADGDDDVETVIAEADAAMYAVKNDTGGSAPTGRTVAARRELAERLGQAVTDGEFVVHYQPIVDLASGRWIGLEALARWDHPERGLLLPAEFIDVVEDVGQSGQLGEIIMRTACDDMRRLRLATGREPTIAVNASVDQMTDPEFPSLVADTLRWGGVDPDRFTIEISERSILERPSRPGAAPVPTNLAALADAGVHLAVDDFGTGYSSLTHLVTFPVDVIKIDRSFVAGVVGDPHRRSVIAALVGLAAGTDMTVVAEGIDQPNQIGVLRELGCMIGQGFHFARPIPYEEIELAFMTDAVLRDQPGVSQG